MFTTSDIGWVVGHSYIVYGPLHQRLDDDHVRGPADPPRPGIWWKIVAEHKVKTMFSSPTAIRVLKKQDPAYMKEHDLSTLKYLFLAGEPLDEPTARWVSDALGVAIVDNYWQTETGWPILSAQLGRRGDAAQVRQPVVPGLRLRRAAAARGDGRARSGADEKGVLTIVPPLPPGCMTTVWGDDERFVKTYFSTFRNRMVYSTFDWATRDADGYYFVLGRTDDVINVAGHRLGTREIEEAVQAHSGIAEVAVVGVADPLKGQVPVAFAVVKDPAKVATPEGVAAMRKEVMDTVDRELGAIARPGAVHFVTVAAEDALGQAAAPVDPGAGRGARSGRPHDDRGSGRARADPQRARRTLAASVAGPSPVAGVAGARQGRDDAAVAPARFRCRWRRRAHAAAGFAAAMRRRHPIGAIMSPRS